MNLAREDLGGLVLIGLVLVFILLLVWGIAVDAYGANSPYIVLAAFAALFVGLAVLWRTR
jgi:hypothetical protein